MTKRVFTLAHPVLLALVPIVALYARNPGDVAPGTVALVAVVSMAAAAALLALLTLVIRNAQRASLVASLVIVLFFLYGHVFDLVSEQGWTSKQVHAIVGSTWVVLLATGTIVAARLRRDPTPCCMALSTGAALMLAMSSFNVATHIVASASTGQSNDAQAAGSFDFSRPAPVAPAGDDDPARPDVYYIVLDGYARADVLQNVYGFDNSEFLQALRERGFFVAERSVANYPMTYLSLASSLNMDYLDSVIEQMPVSSMSRAPYYRLIQNPAVGRLFRSRGYRYIHFATNWRGTEHSEIADLIQSYRPRWLRGEFMEVLIRTTALRPFEPNVAGIHLHTFRTLQEIPRMRGPKFVFAHLIAPHNPYVFDRHGNIRHDIPLRLQFTKKTGGWKDRQAYVDQLVFVNRKVLESIDAILARSKTPPVILLQSDHGSASLMADEKAAPEQWETFVRERLPILNAYLVPPGMRAALDDSTSPVNSFRLLFNELFATDYPQLPNRHYMSWYRTPNRIVDVSDIAERGAPGQEAVSRYSNLASELSPE